MLAVDHGLARDRAARWGLLWLTFADRAAEHLSSLDAVTDMLPIVRWYNRWQTALRRGQLAQLRAHYHAEAVRIGRCGAPSAWIPHAFNPLWSPDDVQRVLRRAGLR